MRRCTLHSWRDDARLSAPILGICYENSRADVSQGQHNDTLEHEAALPEISAPLMHARRKVQQKFSLGVYLVQLLESFFFTFS